MSRKKIFYGWYVVAISLIIMTAAYGVYFSWPVFYVPILNEFRWSRAATALIFSLGSIVYTFASVASGFLFDRFGPRKLFVISAIVIAVGALGCSRSTEIWHFYIFFGFFVASGACSAGFVPNLALVSNWFEKKRATAVGISQMGTRDSFLLTPLIQAAILALGWRSSFMVLAAGTAAIVIALAMFLRARPQDMGLLPDGDTVADTKENAEQIRDDDFVIDKEWASTEWTLARAIKKYRFWACFVLLLGAGFSFTSLINHFVALMNDVGFTAMFAASLLLIYAITAMLGRCGGFISDLIGREVTFTISMILMFSSLVILLLTKDASMPWLMYIFVAVFGFGSGLYTPCYAAGAADLFQGKQFGTIIGTANMGYGVGAAIGTWLYGYIFDVTRSYFGAIVITMISVFVMAVSIWVASPGKVRRVAGRKVAKVMAH